MDIEAGAKAFMTRRDTDPRQYAVNYRNSLIFLVLDGKSVEIVPLAWALSARKPGWELTTRSMNSGNARKIAEASGLQRIEAGHPRHDEFWQASLAECLDLTRRTLRRHKQQFSRHHGRPRRPEDNSYYLLLRKADDALSPQDAAARPGVEGAAFQITTNRYERDPALRAACIAHFRARDGGGLLCQVCGMDFASRYGPIGDGFIHVHHVNPLGNRQAVHSVNPATDLAPVCPNCHAMIHRAPGRAAFGVEEVRSMLAARDQD